MVRLIKLTMQLFFVHDVLEYQHNTIHIACVFVCVIDVCSIFFFFYYIYILFSNLLSSLKTYFMTYCTDCCFFVWRVNHFSVENLNTSAGLVFSC